MAKSPTPHMMMPRNKTGIFASEFQNYNNNNNNNNSSSSSNTSKYIKYSTNYQYNNYAKAAAANEGRLARQFDENQCIGYRKHSAFKIRVKPRQVMSAVNTKLIEQRSRPESRTMMIRASQTSRTAKSGASSARIDIVSSSENNENKNNTESATDNGGEYGENGSSVRDDSADNFTSTKDVFRPSTVKTAASQRRSAVREKTASKLVENQATTTTAPPHQPVINIRILSSKSSNNNNPPPPTTIENPMAVRRKVNNNTPMSLSQPSLVLTSSKEDRPVAAAIHYVNLNSENTIMGTGQSMFNPNISTSHHHHHQQQQQHQTAALNPKASYNSISSSSSGMSGSVNYQPAFNLQPHQHQTTLARTESDLKASNLLNSIKISTEATSTFDASSSLLIKNLNEEDFVKLLKEYRQTKTINLSNLMPQSKNQNQQSSSSGCESRLTQSRIQTPNLSSESRRLLSARHVDLSSTPSRSQLFPTAPLPSKMDTLTLANDSSESNYQLLSGRVPTKSAPSYSIESQKNILRANLENPNNRAPRFFVNYINNRFENKNTQPSEKTSNLDAATRNRRPVTTKSAGSSKFNRLPPGRYEKSASELTNPLRLNDRNKSAATLTTPRAFVASTKNVSLDDFGDGGSSDNMNMNNASDSNMGSTASARLNKIRAFNFPEMAN